jgi:hypothetical protein
MGKFRKFLRLTGLVLLIFMALMGISLTGVFPIGPNYRERYMENEIKIERVEKKEDETRKANPDEIE